MQTLPSVKLLASKRCYFILRGELKPVLCDNLDLWDGMEGEGEVQEEGAYVYV